MLGTLSDDELSDDSNACRLQQYKSYTKNKRETLPIPSVAVLQDVHLTEAYFRKKEPYFFFFTYLGRKVRGVAYILA